MKKFIIKLGLVSCICWINQSLAQSPTNDFFTNSTPFTGTNIAYTGSCTGATFEPGEPFPGRTNTIWISWTAPATGRAHYNRYVTPHWGNCIAYTGPSVDQLSTVPVSGEGNGNYGFLATEGSVYHFQFVGDDDGFYFELWHTPYGPADNDNFADAVEAKGQTIFLPNKSVLGAGMELGEPAHLGPVPQKSLWWKWQAPNHGLYEFSFAASLASNVLVAAYTGNSVESLTLLGKATNSVRVAVNGGDTCYIAGVVPTNTLGDIAGYFHYVLISPGPRIVPGNLLWNASWEGEGPNDPQRWESSGAMGGYVNEPGGADGRSWPVLYPGTKVWQDIPTVPGQNHAVRFALKRGGAQVRVLWDAQQIGVTSIPSEESGFWHWAEFTALAHYPTSRVTFESTGGYVEVDGFIIVSLTAPPEIVTQPSSVAGVAGGSASFVVGTKGAPPLIYTWHLNGSPRIALTNPVLTLTSLTTNQAGTYQAIVTNAYGAATSAPVSLTVEVISKPVILWQPYGDTVGVGGYFNFSVAALGTLPINYQWYKDGNQIINATNRTLTFDTVDYTNAGVYAVRVENALGVVWSLDTRLIVTNALNGGGSVHFANIVPSEVQAPVFDTDGVTPLAGSNFLAQLYGAPSLGLLRPVGIPSAFLPQASLPGYFYPRSVKIPTVAPGSNAIVQVRAWDARAGSSYEEARALGGKFGKSQLFTVIPGGIGPEGPIPPPKLVGLESFNLQAGMPQFTTGQIEFVERQPGNVIVWSHRGEPGFRYVIEKSIHGFEWKPYAVVTNVTSSVTFTDLANSESTVVFYRSRILD